jgi:cbb3-type cytochrome oxidase subunit 3
MLFIRNLLITFYLVMLAVILSALRPGASPAAEEKTF